MVSAFKILGPESATLSSAPNIKRSFSCYLIGLFPDNRELPLLKAGIRKQKEIVAKSGNGCAFRCGWLL